jgi:hypothetical protein
VDDAKFLLALEELAAWLRYLDLVAGARDAVDGLADAVAAQDVEAQDVALKRITETGSQMITLANRWRGVM